MTDRDLSTLKTSSLLFVGGFLLMWAIALIGSAGAALASAPARDASADEEARLAWAGPGHEDDLTRAPSVYLEAAAINPPAQR